MTLDELIYTRLAGDPILRQKLAQYEGEPAIFFQKAPDDTDSHWGNIQYPRMEYLVDMTADPERHSSGIVTVHIYSAENGIPADDIGRDVCGALRDIILQADRPYCIRWSRTELFELSDAKSPETLVNGCTLVFLLIAFPLQETQTPDPALAVQEFIKAWRPETFVLGKDRIEKIYEPSNSRPAFYVRVVGYKPNHSTYALRWIDCTVEIHAIAPTPEGRNGWTRHLADTLIMLGEVMMLDGSPMLVRDLSVDNTADYLVKGQLAVIMQYSIPSFRLGFPGRPLNHVNINTVKN